MKVCKEQLETVVVHAFCSVAGEIAGKAIILSKRKEKKEH